MTLTDYQSVRQTNDEARGILLDFWVEGTDEGPRHELGPWHSHWRTGLGKLFVISNMQDHRYEAATMNRQQQLERMAIHRNNVENQDYTEWYTGEGYTMPQRLERPIYAAVAPLDSDRITRLVALNSRDIFDCEHIFSQNDMGILTCDFCGEIEEEF